jgi:hypothetical protein
MVQHADGHHDRRHAALATLVAGIGLYEWSHAQSRNARRDRLADGASATRAVRWMVLRQVGAIAVVGGDRLGLALLIGRAARSLLFGLEFHDASVLAASLAALMFVAVAAGCWPAAPRVDPMRALKYE